MLRSGRWRHMPWTQDAGWMYLSVSPNPICRGQEASRALTVSWESEKTSICSLKSTFLTRLSSQVQHYLTTTTTAQWLHCRSGQARVLHSLKIMGEWELPAWELLQVITNVNKKWIGSLEIANKQTLNYCINSYIVMLISKSRY